MIISQFDGLSRQYSYDLSMCGILTCKALISPKLHILFQNICLYIGTKVYMIRVRSTTTVTKYNNDEIF